MVRRYVGLLLILQLAVACSQEATPTAERQTANAVARSSEQTAPEKLVLAFGDSLYAGYGLKQPVAPENDKPAP